MLTSSGEVGSMENMLLSLQPALRELRNSMKSNLVEPRYSDDRVDAYLFAYYPAHEGQLRRVLPIFGDRLEKIRKACIFGAGPAPEVHAIDRFVQERYGPHDLQFQLVERRREWQPLRKALKKEIEALVPDRSIDQFTIHEDLRESLPSLSGPLGISDLLVVQNMLNESSDSDWAELRGLIEVSVASLPRGAGLVISDQGRHTVSRARLKELRSKLESIVDIFWDKTDEYVEFPLSDVRIPQIVRDNLFTGEDGLIAKKSVWASFFLGIRR